MNKLVQSSTDKPCFHQRLLKQERLNQGTKIVSNYRVTRIKNSKTRHKLTRQQRSLEDCSIQIYETGLITLAWNSNKFQTRIVKNAWTRQWVVHFRTFMGTCIKASISSETWPTTATAAINFLEITNEKPIASGDKVRTASYTLRLKHQLRNTSTTEVTKAKSSIKLNSKAASRKAPRNSLIVRQPPHQLWCNLRMRRLLSKWFIMVNTSINVLNCKLYLWWSFLTCKAWKVWKQMPKTKSLNLIAKSKFSTKLTTRNQV